MKGFAGFLGNCIAVMLCSGCVAGADNAPARELFMLDGVSIGHTSLDEVRARYGPAAAKRLEDADESDVQICYFSNTGGSAAVSFETGVMGAMKYVTAYRLTTSRPADTCSATAVKIGELATPNGIRLGMSKGTFAKTAGVVFSEKGSELRYEGLFRQAARESGQEESDITIRISANFASDRLIDLRVERFESN
jgi:hypothetical protein